MKKIHFLLLVAAALLTVTTTQAQTNTVSQTPATQQQQKKPRQQHKTPEELAVMQAHHIASELAFDEQTARKFTETYCQYQKELRELKAARPRVKNNEEQTEESIRASILAQFDQSRKTVDLREKYYKEYSRFLTQRQIRRIYAIEREMGQHLNKAGHRNGTPAGKAAGNRPGQR